MQWDGCRHDMLSTFSDVDDSRYDFIFVPLLLTYQFPIKISIVYWWPNKLFVYDVGSYILRHTHVQEHVQEHVQDQIDINTPNETIFQASMGGGHVNFRDPYTIS